MTTKITITGVVATRKFLNGKERMIKIRKQAGLKKASFFLQGEVKESIAGRKAEQTSVDTGRFLNSVDTTIRKDDGIVFSDVPYAKHLEFGTSRINPRRHFRNSKDRNKDKVRKIFKQEINKI